MQMQETFVDWDFDSPIWEICEGYEYPRLWWDQTKYGGGSGMAQDPYQIHSPRHMRQLASDPNNFDKHFILIKDLDMDDYFVGIVFRTNDEIIGDWTNRFTGTFDGNGKKIFTSLDRKNEKEN